VTFTPSPSPSPTLTESPIPSPSPTPTESPSPSPSASQTSPSSTPPQSVSLVPVADSWVGSDAASATHGAETTLYTDGSPTKVSYLKYDLSGLAGRTVLDAQLQITTTSSSWSGSPDAQRVRPVSDSTWTEADLSYSNRPALGTELLGSVTATAGGTTYSVALDRAALQQRLGGMTSLALENAGGDAFYIGSRESATPPRLVLTLQ
jgi:hypothetical protein